MKKLLYILPLLALCVMASCTRNHGDIGPWFGTWHVEAITLGGETIELLDDCFFQFQSGVFRVSMVDDRQRLVESFGAWEETQGGKLIVSFPDVSVYYIQVPGLEAYNDFKIEELKNGHLTLSKVLTDGSPCTFILKKQP